MEREIQEVTEIASPLLCLLGFLGLSGTLIYCLNYLKRRVDGELMPAQNPKPKKPIEFVRTDLSYKPPSPEEIKAERAEMRANAFAEYVKQTRKPIKD